MIEDPRHRLDDRHANAEGADFFGEHFRKASDGPFGRLIRRDALRRALGASLAKLGVDYVDLYMVHWPSRDMDLGAVMETMQGFLQHGTVRSIGVCNFNVTMLRKAIEEIGAPIACHQIEYHAFLDQSKMLSYLREQGIPLVAYAPMAQGRAASDPVLKGIGVKHGVTAAQVALAWLLEQNGVAVIPKAQRRESQKSNLDALTVRLDDEDRHAIAVLPKDHRFVTPPFAPEWGA